MKGSSDADHGTQHVRKGCACVTIVQMPAFVVVVREARIGGSHGHLVVEQFGTAIWGWLIHDTKPRIDDISGPDMVVGGVREDERHAVLTREADYARTVSGPLIRE